jgi:hypothetical protein
MDVPRVVEEDPRFFNNDFGVVGYIGDKPFRGRLIVEPSRIAFDSSNKALSNRFIGLGVSPREVPIVVHTMKDVVLLKVGRSRWLMIDDSSARQRVLVRVQWTHRQRIQLALKMAGFRVHERETTRGGLRELAHAGPPDDPPGASGSARS